MPSTIATLFRAVGRAADCAGRLPRTLLAVALVCAFANAVTPPALAQASGARPAPAATPNSSGLPLPRFVTLRADEANLRTGPGVQYPVEWVYQRKEIPLEVIAEFETWRKVRDWQGAQGWMHQSMLESKRTAVITGLTRSLRAKMDANSAVVAEIDVDVVGRIVECPQGAGWCRLSFGNHDGWLRRAEIGGVYPDEAVR